MRLPALDPFMMAVVFGVAGGALFGLLLWMREHDPRRRLFHSVQFWGISAAALAMLGLAETWLIGRS